MVEKLGNVSEASYQSGVSRDKIFHHLKLIKQDGAEALKRQERTYLSHKSIVDIEIEKAVVQLSIEHPHLGQQKIS